MSELRRYFEIAGITVQVESDLAMSDSTFAGKFTSFRVEGPGPDTVVIRRHFGIPPLVGPGVGASVYHRPPWEIYRSDDDWVYVLPQTPVPDLTEERVAVFNANHSVGEFYNDATGERAWRGGGLPMLTGFTTDQILLARLVADRQSCMFHSSAVTINGAGLLFLGQSDAGKSTTVGLLRSSLGAGVHVLCDDRNIVRRWSDGFRVHGTWHHGDIPEVSSGSAPLAAILILRHAECNRIVPVATSHAVQAMLATLVRPMVTSDWWHKELDVIESLARAVPCYTMYFDKSGAIVPELAGLAR